LRRGEYCGQRHKNPTTYLVGELRRCAGHDSNLVSKVGATHKQAVHPVKIQGERSALVVVQWVTFALDDVGSSDNAATPCAQCVYYFITSYPSDSVPDSFTCAVMCSLLPLRYPCWWWRRRYALSTTVCYQKGARPNEKSRQENERQPANQTPPFPLHCTMTPGRRLTGYDLETLFAEGFSTVLADCVRGSTWQVTVDGATLELEISETDCSAEKFRQR
jgi:hypothetical protein